MVTSSLETCSSRTASKQNSCFSTYAVKSTYLDIKYGRKETMIKSNNCHINDQTIANIIIKALSNKSKGTFSFGS